MPLTDCLTSSVPFASFGSSSVFSLIRDQPFAMDVDLGAGDHELSEFQTLVANFLVDLAAFQSDEFLSMLWVMKLLDTFLLCMEWFRGLLSRRRSIVLRLGKNLLGDFLERGVKALDLCNAVRDGIEELRQWLCHLKIVFASLDAETLNEGRVRRAKKAITKLALVILEEKETGSVLSQRYRSFARSMGDRSSSAVGGRNHRRFHSPRLVSFSWSAARQLQAIGSRMTSPRRQETVSTSGLAVVVYTMKSVLFFVMWSLVAAFPCQDRRLQMHISVPYFYPWSEPILSLYQRITEESKKKDRRSSKGLLKEIHQMERRLQRLRELTDAVQFPVAKEKETEIRQRVEELAQVCNALMKFLDPMECQVKEVFRLIARSRTEAFDFFASNR